MGKLFRRLGTACAAGLVSYAFPRLLIEFGVPLDVWIVTMGTVLDLSPDWVNFDTATWIITLVLGFVLFGVEEWWHPFRKIWQLVVLSNNPKSQHLQDVRVSTPQELERSLAESEQPIPVTERPENKQQILTKIAKLRENGVGRRNHFSSFRLVNDHVREEIYALREGILDEVRKISPSEAEALKTLDTFDYNDHPRNTHDKKEVVEFSEFLRRVMAFIKEWQGR